MTVSQRPELSSVVIAALFVEMERMVDAYDENARPICGRVDGTAFFPGGVGLWRGLTPQGEIPKYFPAKPVMFLGHNFDSVDACQASVARKIEVMNVGTWLGQQTYMRMADIDPLDCFFTNFYPAIKPNGSRGALEASHTLKEQCRDFCAYQLERTDPSLVVVMGGYIPDQFKLVKHSAHFIEVDHPSFPVQCGPGTDKSNAAYEKNVKKLREKLEEIGYYSRKAKARWDRIG